MTGAKQTLLIATSFVVLLGSLAVVAWLVVGSAIVASTGTLPGSWHRVSVEVTVLAGAGIALAILLFWIAVKKPKPLRE